MCNALVLLFEKNFESKSCCCSYYLSLVTQSFKTKFYFTKYYQVLLYF